MSRVPKIFSDTLWYHGDLSRHAAEVLLMLNGKDGSFLLRRHDVGLFSISARTEGSVKHFKLECHSSRYRFGDESFNSPDKVIDFFGQQPKIGTRRLSEQQNVNNGTLVVLKYPYPANPPEPPRFDEIKTLCTTFSAPQVTQEASKVTSMATKDGFLKKEGAKVKSWKRRWFTCVRNELSYFETKAAKTPIFTIDLTTARRCKINEEEGKGKFFTLECPERTWNFQSETEEEAFDWVELLNFKLDHK